MNSIWYSLVWKEWHEHKWKLVSMVAVLCGATAFVLPFVDLREYLYAAFILLGLCLLPLALFVGFSAAANERSRNTLPFLQALPAPLWRVALVKVVAGLLTLLVAIILALVFAQAWKYVPDFAGRVPAAYTKLPNVDRITGIWFLDRIIILGAFAAGVFAWSAAAGVNRRDEISAGAMAVIVVVGWSLLLALIYLVLASSWYIDFQDPHQRDKWAWLAVLSFSTLPGGIFPAGAISQQAVTPMSLTLTYMTAATTYSLLLASYVCRFGKLKNTEIRSHQNVKGLTAKTEWLSTPRRSPATAIIWKQCRESGPVAITGIAVSAAVTLIAIVISIFDVHLSMSQAIGQTYPFMAIFFGMIVALVAGIGVCLNDMNPKLNELWRSRPIQPDLWFWIKFVTGLLVVLASIYVPIGILAALRIPISEGWDRDARYLPPLIQLAVFAAAVVTTCLVRQAVYAAILSIAVVYLGTLTGMAICLLPAWLRGENVNLFRDPSPLQTAFGLATSFAISTILAWLAVRYDWGKKSRY